MRVRCLIVLFTCVWPVQGMQLADAQQAWERSIEAKGGRERLHSIQSVVLSSTSLWGIRGINQIKVSYETLLVPPGRLWDWVDQRASKMFGLKVRIVDLSKSYAQITYHDGTKPDEPNPAGKPSIDHRRRVRKLQLDTFMETAWVKPQIVKMWEATDWFVPETVIETQVEEQTYEWHLDRRTHLPRKAIVRTPTNYGIHVEEVRLEDYRLVEGLQLPHIVAQRNKGDLVWFTQEIRYQLNVDYDEAIFRGPPSIAAGPKAWMRQKQK